jgi:hypothetical protein
MNSIPHMRMVNAFAESHCAQIDPREIHHNSLNKKRHQVEVPLMF